MHLSIHRFFITNHHLITQSKIMINFPQLNKNRKDILPSAASSEQIGQIFATFEAI